MRKRAPTVPRIGVTLSEEDGIRFLHFGTEWVQGAMRIARPWSLELEYQRQMMSIGLFIPRPARVLQLGLGAAALTKFCYKRLPQAEVVAVELSGEVIRAARQWFRLPEDDQRLSVVEQDALAYIADPAHRSRSDWLQVDLYDARARGPVYDDVGFYAACKAALTAPGVAVFNLFGSRFDPSFAAIAKAFADRVLVLPEVEFGNRVVLAFNGPRIDVGFDILYERAKELEADWGLPARRWLAGLRNANELGDRLVL